MTLMCGSGTVSPSPRGIVQMKTRSRGRRRMRATTSVLAAGAVGLAGLLALTAAAAPGLASAPAGAAGAAAADLRQATVDEAISALRQNAGVLGFASDGGG